MKNSAGRQLFLWAYMLTVTDDHFKACDSAGVIRILVANCRANTLALQQEKKIQFQDAMVYGYYQTVRAGLVAIKGAIG